jgi:uncharacterized protein (DUF1778 family)
VSTLAAKLIPQSFARLEACISVDLHRMIKSAAQIQGRALTDCVTGVLLEATQQVIERAEVVRLSLEDQRCCTLAIFTCKSRKISSAKLRRVL